MLSKISMKSKNRNTVLNKGIIYILLSGTKSVACSVSWGFPRSSEVCVNVCVCVRVIRLVTSTELNGLSHPCQTWGGGQKGRRMTALMTHSHSHGGNLEHTQTWVMTLVSAARWGRQNVHRLPFKCLNGALNTPKMVPIIYFNKTNTAYWLHSIYSLYLS